MRTRNKRCVWIKNSVVQFIIDQAKHWGNLETGGILAGYVSGGDIVVTQIVGPGPKAKHTASSFKPDSKYHSERIAEIYERSNREDTYLGDWHTHPNARSYLSPKDKETLVRIGNYKKARMPSPIMLVLGTEKMEIKVWNYYRNGERKEIVDPCRVFFYD